MAYIRIKKISNKPYAYLVKNISTSKGPRQKVKKYLGRIHEIEKRYEEESLINAQNKSNFLKQLIKHHLQNHGFKEKNNFLTNKNLNFSLKNLKFNKGVIKLNEGYLCNFTIERILKFKKSKDLEKDGNTLAKYLLTAGLPVSQEEFINFYSLL